MRVSALRRQSTVCLPVVLYVSTLILSVKTTFLAAGHNKDLLFVMSKRKTNGSIRIRWVDWLYFVHFAHSETTDGLTNLFQTFDQPSQSKNVSYWGFLEYHISDSNTKLLPIE